MDFHRWYLVVGVLLLLMVVLGRRLQRLPVSTAMLYLAFGYALAWSGALAIDPVKHRAWLERLSEVAVIVSLFSAGLKLRLPLKSPQWRLPVLLAFGSMSITVGLMALAGVYWLALPWGAAVLLGAIVAPTDPVLASDVQVSSTADEDPVRFTLTGEAGLNDGTAFPFVMLGLGLLGLHPLGIGGWRWWAFDVLWATSAGLLLGALLGMAVARFIVYLRREHQEATGLDDFLAMGMIAIAYGLAHVIGAYGFLSVFAAGLALRMVERRLSPGDAPPDVKAAAQASEEVETHPEKAPAYMAEAVLHFNEHLERIGELTMALLVGAILAIQPFAWESVGIAALLFLVIRPASVLPAAGLLRLNRRRTALVAWFGVRGIGSVYYLFFALGFVIDAVIGERLVAITTWVIVLSIALHGITVTPLMFWYERSLGRSVPGSD